MLSMERIPDQIGYLVLTEDGAILASGGELGNDERIANVIIGLVTLISKDNSKAFFAEDFEKISITYSDHCYIICLSNKKINVVKKRLTSSSTLSPESQLIEISS